MYVGLEPREFLVSTVESVQYWFIAAFVCVRVCIVWGGR